MARDPWISVKMEMRTHAHSVCWRKWRRCGIVWMRWSSACRESLPQSDAEARRRGLSPTATKNKEANDVAPDSDTNTARRAGGHRRAGAGVALAGGAA